MKCLVEGKIYYGSEQRISVSFTLMVPCIVRRNSMRIKIQPDAAVCRYLFTAKLLYMIRVSQHPSSGVLKTVTAASGTGHTTGTAGTQSRSDHVGGE